MIDEFRLTRPAGLALRAACGSLTRSARLLILEVTERQILTLSFKDPKSTIINHQSIPLRLTAAVASASLSEFVYRDQGRVLGIGLSLVKQLVSLHGGSVKAHSDGSGQGSEFEVRLPLYGEGDEDPAAPAAVIQKLLGT